MARQAVRHLLGMVWHDFSALRRSQSFSHPCASGTHGLNTTMEGHPGMTSALILLYSWNPQLFATSLGSYVAGGLGPRIIIVDNSEDGRIYNDMRVSTPSTFCFGIRAGLTILHSHMYIPFVLADPIMSVYRLKVWMLVIFNSPGDIMMIGRSHATCFTISGKKYRSPSAITCCADQVHGWTGHSDNGAVDILSAAKFHVPDSSRPSADLLFLGTSDVAVLPSTATSSFSEEVLGCVALSATQSAHAQTSNSVNFIKSSRLNRAHGIIQVSRQAHMHPGAWQSGWQSALTGVWCSMPMICLQPFALKWLPR